MIHFDWTRPARAAVFAGILLAAFPLAALGDENQLTLNTATGAYDFTVEVVNTDETRARGLMYRDSLADDAGMLFDFIDERTVSFWMRNTLIPLDMIFIGADGVVKTVHVNARPLDPTGISSQVPVQYVLEIPGGRSVEIGLEPGDTVEHTLIEPAPE